jgi:hypothetical protein
MRPLPEKIWSTMTAFRRQAHFHYDQNRTHIAGIASPIAFKILSGALS